MKLKSGFLPLLLLALLSTGFYSCQNVLETHDSKTAAVSGEGTVSFTLNAKKVSARMALPTLDMSSYTFSILATADDGSSKTLAEGLSSDNLSQKFTLTRAKWIFTVQAYTAVTDDNPTATLVLEGSSDQIDLVSKTTASVDLTLSATTNGTGSVSIPVTLSSKGVASVVVGVYDNAIGGTLVSGTEKTFTASDSINTLTDNGDGTYSFTYTVSDLPSGTTYYACFTLYDEAGAVCGYYTESVYIVAGETSAPVVYVKNDDGDVVVDEDATSITVDPNLFTTTVSYEAVDVENGESREIVVRNTETGNEYTLYDEDGDGVYDNALPPGTYEVVTVKTTAASGETTKTDISEEAITLTVTTDVDANTTVASKLASVSFSYDGADSAQVSATMTVVATATDGSVVPESALSVAWYRSASNSTSDGTLISSTSGTSYTPSATDAASYIYAVVTQSGSSSLSATSAAVLIANGAISSSSLTVTYGSGDDALTLTGDSASGITLTLSSGSASLDSDELSVSGVTDALSGEALSATAAFSSTSFTASGTVSVLVSAAGYDELALSVAVTVKAATPTADTAPALSTDTGSIAVGCIQFVVTDDTSGIYEYSIDGGTTWVTLTADTSAFEVSSSVTSVLLRVQATGSADEGTAVAASDSLSITIADENRGAQITLSAVSITYPDSDSITVGKTLTATALSESGTAATGLGYQWQRASSSASDDDDWSDIDGATLSTYVLSQDDYDAYVRVKVTQAGAAAYSEATTTAVAAGTLSDTWSLTFTESGADDDAAYSVSGTEPITITLSSNDENASATISGSLSVVSAADNISGASVSGATAAFTDTTALTFTVSGTVSVTLSATGYADKTVTLAVQVCAASPSASDIPLLSTEQNTVSAGAVAFAEASDTLEYSVDGGESYSAITTASFYASGNTEWSAGDTFLVRVAETGSAEAGTYRAPSAPVSVEIAEGNIGTKPAVSIGTITYSGDIAVSATTDSDSVTVSVTSADAFTSFSWQKNGNTISGETNSSLTLDTSDWESGTYTITVVGVKNGLSYSATVPVIIE